MDKTFKQAMAALDISPIELARLTKAKLTADEYFVRDGKKWISEAGMEKLKLAGEVPLAVPSRVMVRGVRSAPNPRWLYCKVEGKDAVVPVMMPWRLSGKMIGKPFYVEIIKDGDGGVTYRHESLTV